MKTSEQINELATALAKAQGQIVGALKDSTNPFFKSKYADLASCWEACRQQLSSNGLAVIQGAETRYSDTGVPAQIVTTLLSHSSGQWVESVLQVHPKDDSPQAAGSAITYARRYALAAMVGLAQVDDDAEAAQGRHTNGKPDNKHDPRGDLGKDISALQAEATAQTMLEILEEDLLDELKQGKVYQTHAFLNTQQSLYVAASDVLKKKKAKSFPSNPVEYWKDLVHKAIEAKRANGHR